MRLFLIVRFPFALLLAALYVAACVVLIPLWLLAYGFVCPDKAEWPYTVENVREDARDIWRWVWPA